MFRDLQEKEQQSRVEDVSLLQNSKSWSKNPKLESVTPKRNLRKFQLNTFLDQHRLAKNRAE
jgi:hypothetical protein